MQKSDLADVMWCDDFLVSQSLSREGYSSSPRIISVGMIDGAEGCDDDVGTVT